MRLIWYSLICVQSSSPDQLINADNTSTGVPLSCTGAHDTPFRPHPTISPPRFNHNHCHHLQKPPHSQPTSVSIPFLHSPTTPPFPNSSIYTTGVENGKDLQCSSIPAIIRAMSELYHPLLQWFQSHTSPPIAILSDIFLGWTQHLAAKIGIPRIAFSPSGALALALTDCLWRELPLASNHSDLIPFPKIPNSPVYPWWQLSTVYQNYVEQPDGDSELLRDGMLANIQSWGMILNTFSEIHAIYLQHLKKDYGHDRVWAVGPLLPSSSSSPNGSSMDRGGASSVDAQHLLSWLDTCPDHSVVYISFGTRAIFTDKQMEALESGFELSGVRFIWSVKESSKGRVPSGFEDRTHGKGLVIKGWAPQVLILNHPAVGSSMIHCGWNSILEGIVAGVPMLAWPMRADQFSNATLVVSQLRVAVTVCEGAMTVPDVPKLAQKLRDSVGNDQSKRERIRALAKVAMSAVEEGGSSLSDLDDFVQQLRGLE